MAEYKNPQEGNFKEGHFPNTSNTVLELHRLLALFLASKSFAALRTNFPGEGFDPIYKIQDVEEDEITRLLLNLAITARVIDDRQDRALERVGSNCGQLEKNGGGDQQVEALNLREACNKIIHAKKIRFDVEEDAGQSYLNPFIYLYGEQNGKSWKATLDIVAFSKEYFSLVCYF
ncbi:MAG: hypothetical protein Q7J36_12745 [Thiobacillus sp.]|nr:hypothetical protein [Thiobacillus sp.]